MISLRRTILFTLATGEYHEILRYTGPLLQAYAQRWGWEYQVVTKSLDNSRPEAWSKIRKIIELLSSYDTVIYIDSDALIMNFDTNILEEVPNESEFAWVVGVNNGMLLPNAGVMVIRSCKNSVSLMSRAYDLKDGINDPWWEQLALMRVLGYPDPRTSSDKKNLQEIITLPMAIFHLNSKWNVTSQEIGLSQMLIRHFAGDPLLVKKMMIIDYISRLFSEEKIKEVGLSLGELRSEYNQIRQILYSQKTSKMYFYFSFLKRVIKKILDR